MAWVIFFLKEENYVSLLNVYTKSKCLNDVFIRTHHRLTTYLAYISIWFHELQHFQFD